MNNRHSRSRRAHDDAYLERLPRVHSSILVREQRPLNVAHKQHTAAVASPHQELERTDWLSRLRVRYVRWGCLRSLAVSYARAILSKVLLRRLAIKRRWQQKNPPYTAR